MINFKFKVGDIVRYIDGESTSMIDHIGTILDYGESSSSLGNWYYVKWNIRFDFYHDCNGRCEYGYGWNVYEDSIVCKNYNRYQKLRKVYGR